MITALAFPKPARRKDRVYLRFIRRQGCLVCRRYAQAHHVHSGGVGTKGNDYDTVPLCFKHHPELHTMGQAAFEQKHDLNLERSVMAFREQYGRQRGKEIC